MTEPVYNFTYHHNGSGGVFKAFSMTKKQFIWVVKDEDADGELRQGPASVEDANGNEVAMPDLFWQLPESTQFALCIEREREKYAVGITVLLADK